jgi:hypothetical protein
MKDVAIGERFYVQYRTPVESLETRFYALVRKKSVDKQRKCLKCGKTFRIKEGSRRGSCHPCAIANDRMGMTASYHNICS